MRSSTPPAPSPTICSTALKLRPTETAWRRPSIPLTSRMAPTNKATTPTPVTNRSTTHSTSPRKACAPSRSKTPTVGSPSPSVAASWTKRATKRSRTSCHSAAPIGATSPHLPSKRAMRVTSSATGAPTPCTSIPARLRCWVRRTRVCTTGKTVLPSSPAGKPNSTSKTASRSTSARAASATSTPIPIFPTTSTTRSRAATSAPATRSTP